MKAIQVKTLPETATKPTRLKAWCEGVKPVIKSIDSFDNHPFKSAHCQCAELIANQFGWLEYNSWNESERVLRGGQIANGDHVFVVVDVPFNVKKLFIEFKEC